MNGLYRVIEPTPPPYSLVAIMQNGSQLVQARGTDLHDVKMRGNANVIRNKDLVARIELREQGRTIEVLWSAY